MIQSTFLFNFLIYHDLAMVIMAEIELWCHQRHRRSILLLYFIMQQSISKGKHNLSIFNQFCVWTWRLTLQSPPAAWKRSGTASVTILAIFWPLLSDSCVTILSWHVVTATETICGIVRVAAALRPGYRRPATSHSGAAEAARWPAGTSCPLTEDKWQWYSGIDTTGEALARFTLHTGASLGLVETEQWDIRPPVIVRLLSSPSTYTQGN